MANHGFVTTRKWLNPEQIRQDLEEIIDRRFKGKLQICEEGSAEDVPFWCQIEPKNMNEPWEYKFSVQLTTGRKLEFRHPPNDWAFWAQVVFQNELGEKYEGMISDEGVEERWRPIAEKFPTYKSWVHHLHQPMSSDKAHIKAVKYIARLLCGNVPKQLKGL